MRLLSAFQAKNAVAAVLNPQTGVLIEVSDNFFAVLGYRPEQIVGKAPVEFDLWPNLDERSAMWAQVRETGHIVDLKCSVRCADQTVLNAILSAEYIQHSPDQEHLFCLLQIIGGVDSQDGKAEPKNLYESMYFHASEGMYRMLANGGFVDVNPSLFKALGYDSSEQVLREYGRDISPLHVDQDNLEQLVQRLLENGRVNGWRSQIKRRDGSVMWVNQNARVVYHDDGRPAFFEGTVIDITANIQARDALLQTQSQYRAVVDQSSDGVYLVQKGKILFANKAVSDLLEYQPEQLIGMDYLDLIHPDDLQLQKDRLAARLSGDDSHQSYEVRMLTQTGKVIECEIRADGLMYQGELASTGTIRNAGERRAQVLALAAAEKRYRGLFESSPIGLFRNRIDGTVDDFNEPMARMMGYDSIESARRELKHMNQIYAKPEQREAIVQDLLKQGFYENFQLEVRVRDGSTKVISITVQVVADESGRPLYLTGSAQDLTERLRIEAALLESERKYRNLVENSQTGVFLLNQSHEFVYVNKFFCDILGFDEQELVGSPYSAILDQRDIERKGSIDAVALEHFSKSSAFETSMRHKNGQRLFVRLHFAETDQHEKLITGTALNITQQRQAEERLRHLATHDPLTGLPNRLMFNRRLSDVLAKANQSGEERKQTYAVLFLDMDGFKWVNDSLGHGAGDRLLVEIARRLENVLVHECLIARYGGDEFTILPDGPCDYQRAADIAQRILRSFSSPFDLGDQQVFSGASVGIVLARDEYQSPDQILRDADTAMYQAKAAGKSQFVIFDEAMHAKVRQRFELETQFRVALERKEFCLHYQPVVDLLSGRMLGVEALVRWRHPQKGLLTPGSFYDIAEETGLITELDEWVVKEACRQLADWRDHYPSAHQLWVNVNCDERRLASPELVEQIFQLLQQHRIPAHLLRLEVTERAFERGRAHAEERLVSLKGLGIGLVVDDFGTGYSSLEAFASSPFDALKVDQVFVRDIDTNPRHAAIVRTIIGFAKDLKLQLTAEGIETESQRKVLLSMGCQLGQGYLFHRPMAASDLAEQLLKPGV
jgi:diguanylate cyclase (GGDEF)-like protein/PAS domain S-box-containing protein